MFLAPLLVFDIRNWVHIPFEEAKMRRQFGAAFDRYTRGAALALSRFNARRLPAARAA